MVGVLPVFFLAGFESYRRGVNASRLYFLVLVLVTNGRYWFSLLGYIVSIYYEPLSRNILVDFLLKVDWQIEDIVRELWGILGVVLEES